MPFLHGAVVSAGIKYRFIIAVLLVYILYSQWRHNNDLYLIIEKAGNDMASCQNYAESLVAKLRVVYDHKIKMEKIFNSKRVSTHEKRKASNWHLRSVQRFIRDLLQAELDQCRSGKHEQIPHPDLSGKVLLDRLQGEVNTLRSMNASLNNSLSSCQDMMEKYIGAIPVDQYTQNETAFFDRKHKVGDVLAFDRNQQAFEPPTLMPAKELVAKLAEKARQLRRGEEEADKHPDDRENNGERATASSLLANVAVLFHRVELVRHRVLSKIFEYIVSSIALLVWFVLRSEVIALKEKPHFMFNYSMWVSPIVQKLRLVGRLARMRHVFRSATRLVRARGT
ncbi:hypothetical protein GCK32_005262 [Trichostrongylus colubriformis]|uniref:Uncharacterized protein n=1 Tax=Trichostrongylus colubriformis TaxID=6319 RepID=A0AAN8IPH8_TRICO